MAPSNKPPSTASSTDSSNPSTPASPTSRLPPASTSTGATRNPPLSPPRPIFLGIGRRSDEDDSVPPTPDPRANPFGTPGDMTPSLSPSSRVQSTGSGFGYFPPADITTRSSGILSVHATTTVTTTTEHGLLAHARNASAVSNGSGLNPFSSGRSNISGLSGVSTGEIAEERRPGLNHRASSAIREAFQSPPPRPLTIYGGSRTASTVNVGGAGGAPPRAPAKRLKSTMLTGEIDKPWTKKKDTVARVAYWLTYGVAFLGIVASAVRCYFGYLSVPKFKHPLCQVLDDEFDTFNTDIWQHEVQLDGFGNGEFEMTTDSSNNSFVRDGKLYIMPTLTSDVIGRNEIFNGHMYNLTDCTGQNYTSCGVVSNTSTSTVIPPVMSARLTTKKSRAIRFGRVEIRAKLPRGDWLWPALWMLPKDNVYGEWPLSGEIDIMESRGNDVTYPKQGRNYVRGSLNWGPTSFLNAVYKTYGWWTMRRSSYDQGFHTYALEWTEDWMRIYVDTRLHHMLDLRFNKPFWQRGNFPAVIQNGTNTIALTDPWINNATVANAAPFDQQFYLIMNVAVGGTNGWFPDNAGDKPWLDDSKVAMSDFAKAQDTWYSSWPQGSEIDDRAMIVDYVKMWEEC